MVQRDHGVGLAAAEVGLQFDDRVAAFAGESARRSRKHLVQALGDVGTGEEGLGVLVFRFSVALQHLKEIGREFGLVEAARCDIGVGCDDLAPRRQSGFGPALGWFGCGAAALGTGLLVDHLAHEVLSQAAYLLTLVGVAEGLEHSFHGVERPHRVVG